MHGPPQQKWWIDHLVLQAQQVQHCVIKVDTLLDGDAPVAASTREQTVTSYVNQSFGQRLRWRWCWSTETEGARQGQWQEGYDSSCSASDIDCCCCWDYEDTCGQESRWPRDLHRVQRRLPRADFRQRHVSKRQCSHSRMWQVRCTWSRRDVLQVECSWSWCISTGEGQTRTKW